MTIAKTGLLSSVLERFRQEPALAVYPRTGRRRVSSSRESFESAWKAGDELLAASTEILFNHLYDQIAAELAALQERIEPDARELEVLQEIASHLGKRLDDEDVTVSDTEVDQVVWRSPARVTVLTLFDHLADRVDETTRTDPSSAVTVADCDWVEAVLSDPLFDEELFSSQSHLRGDEVRRALGIGARVATECQAFQVPGDEIRYNGINFVVVADAKTHMLNAVGTDAATVAFLEVDQFEEDADSYYFPAGEARIRPVSRSLFWETVGEQLVLSTKAAGLSAPAPPVLSLLLTGGRAAYKRWGRRDDLRFKATSGNARLTVPRNEVHALSNGFLLKSNV